MIINKNDWKTWVRVNDDPYGKACVDVARETMRLLDTDNYRELDTYKIICDADKNVAAGGITGFMSGCIVQMVTRCHSRGEEFRKAWNKSYDVKEDAKGVVNPAIITIG